MKYARLIALALLGTTPALAQHAHGSKGPNGGQMEDVAGVHAELVTSGPTLTVNIYDEDNKPVATKGFSATVLIVSGSNRETLTLAPQDPNVLKGDAKAAVGAGATVSLTLKTAAGKTGQARFRK